MGQRKLMLDESPDPPRERTFEGNIRITQDRTVVGLPPAECIAHLHLPNARRIVHSPPRRVTRQAKCTAAMRHLQN